MASPAPCPPRPRGTGLTPHYSAARLRLLLPGAGAAGAARAVQAPPGPTASLVRPLVAAGPKALLPPPPRRLPLPPVDYPSPYRPALSTPLTPKPPFPSRARPLSAPKLLISNPWTSLAPF